MDKWHKNFNPQYFLKRIDLSALLLKNEAYESNKVSSYSRPCILCRASGNAGLVLNEGSFLCKACFEKVSLIQYPGRYETLRRNYLVAKEAWSQARQRLISECLYNKVGTFVTLIAIGSLLLLFHSWKWTLLSTTLFAISFVFAQLHASKVAAWGKKFRPPSEPELFHFHDPRAVLTPTDQQILFIFDHWPGYPPYWAYLRDVVLARDASRCQVTGCPSRVSLHIHHKLPVSQGGAHSPVNLLTLCAFHHALEPDEGHERVWGDVRTQFFTLVRRHWRQNRTHPGAHTVRAHLRRLVLVSLTEIQDIFTFYGLSCPNCNSTELSFTLSQARNRIRLSCNGCGNSIDGPRQLTEESGPRMAELLPATKNIGCWKARWEMLSYRKEEKWGSWIVRKGRTKDNIKALAGQPAKPNCPKCGAPMRLVSPKPGDKWQSFWGCTQFRLTGCRGAAKHTQ